MASATAKKVSPAEVAGLTAAVGKAVNATDTEIANIEAAAFTAFTNLQTRGLWTGDVKRTASAVAKYATSIAYRVRQTATPTNG